jgi:hypothetical protein
MKTNGITIASISIYDYLDRFTDVDELRNACKVLLRQDNEAMQKLKSELEAERKVVDWYGDKNNCDNKEGCFINHIDDFGEEIADEGYKARQRIKERLP